MDTSVVIVASAAILCITLLGGYIVKSITAMTMKYDLFMFCGFNNFFN